MKDKYLEFKEQIKSAILDLKTKGRRHRQIPNLLTVLRLMAPFFIIPAAIVGNVPFILGATAFFSLTDLADGFIARNWKLTSELGETLDAVTDKVFASTLLIAASFADPLLLCNLAYEGIIAGINTYKKVNNLPVKSSLTGKLKTWFLFSLIGVGIASPYCDLRSILDGLMLSTTAMQFLTINSYLSSCFEDTNSIVESNNKKECINSSDENSSLSKTLEKTKTFEIDTSTLKTTECKNETVKQLEEIKDFLIAEKSFLELGERNISESNNYCKGKNKKNG